MTSPKGTSTDLVIVCPHMGDGGAQRVVSIMANALHEQGRKIAVLTIFDDPDAYDLHPGIYRWNLQDFPGMKAVTRFVRIRFLRGGQRKGSPHVRKVVRHGFMYVFMAMAVPALRYNLKRIGSPRVFSLCGSTNIITTLAARSNGRLVVISERSDPARARLGAPWDTLRKRLYNRADIVTANSRGALNTLEQYVAKDKLRYLPNPIVLQEGCSAPPAASGDRRHSLLIVGRLHALKGHDVLVKAFASVADELADWDLTIVGRGQQEAALRELSRDMGVEGRINWVYESNEMARRYDEADIFVLPSRYEGSPNALLEAMSHRLACIVSDASPGPQELIANGRTGVTVPVGDVAKLADAIRQLANDEPLRKRLGDQARDRVAEHDIRKVLPVWEEVLNLRAVEA